jgi:hypothetical protein
MAMSTACAVAVRQSSDERWQIKTARLAATKCRKERKAQLEEEIGKDRISLKGPNGVHCKRSGEQVSLCETPVRGIDTGWTGGAMSLESCAMSPPSQSDNRTDQ